MLIQGHRIQERHFVDDGGELHSQPVRPHQIGWTEVSLFRCAGLQFALMTEPVSSQMLPKLCLAAWADVVFAHESSDENERLRLTTLRVVAGPEIVRAGAAAVLLQDLGEDVSSRGVLIDGVAFEVNVFWNNTRAEWDAIPERCAPPS